MGNIRKCGKWVPNELTERQMENRKTICEILLARQKRKSFLHRIVTGNENGFILRILNRENHGLIQESHQHRLQRLIVSARKQCCVYGGTRNV